MKNNKSEPIRAEAVKALAYARVSSKEQEKEGFSIPAQQKLLHSYAANNRLVIVHEYVDIETAKATGRTNFEQMVRYLKMHPNVRTVLVEKTDRLYRNLRDWVTLDELDIEIHLVKEGVVLSRDSKSSEKFVHRIKVLMAKNYIDNLSEEARKACRRKPNKASGPLERRLAISTSWVRMARKPSPLTPRSRPLSHISSDGTRPAPCPCGRLRNKRGRPGSCIAAPASRCRPAPCTRSCATASTPATSNGRAATAGPSWIRIELCASRQPLKFIKFLSSLEAGARLHLLASPQNNIDSGALQPFVSIISTGSPLISWASAALWSW
jgi:hypothetical protein